jgi:hypothetical protein
MLDFATVVRTTFVWTTFVVFTTVMPITLAQISIILHRQVQNVNTNYTATNTRGNNGANAQKNWKIKINKMDVFLKVDLFKNGLLSWPNLTY